MVLRLLAVLLLAAFVSTVVALLAGPPASTGAFVAVAAIGAIVVVLQRNRRDREALEHGSVSGAADRRLSSDAPVGEPL